ncbi:MAG: glyoxylate/hydroxypyruvate reductase A [Alphaproteobacteria bacterium]|nr:glyoxylate/hydroxypyruvate reductase A [Alphaproteobacteria bacterium]
MAEAKAVLVLSSQLGAEDWARGLRAADPTLEVRVWPEFGDPDDIDVIIAWSPEPGQLVGFSKLKAVLSLGAGVDQVLDLPDLAELSHVPVARTVDDGLSLGMTHYVLLHVLRYHRRMPELEAMQRGHDWRFLVADAAAETNVGIMGLGEMGGQAATKLVDLGFGVRGWSRSEKHLPGIDSFAGTESLASFLAGTRILVVLLPLTEVTRGIINAETLGQLPKGAYLIAAGRGGHLVEADVLAALDSGQLAHATLDVFNTEPLPTQSPFWDHPRVTVTPHNASDSAPGEVVPKLLENIRRARSGQPLLNQVDRRRGY